MFCESRFSVLRQRRGLVSPQGSHFIRAAQDSGLFFNLRVYTTVCALLQKLNSHRRVTFAEIC